jgi:hypothetical protein
MVRIEILDDEYNGLVGAGRLWRRHCGVSGALLSEEAETCFVLPLREAFACTHSKWPLVAKHPDCIIDVRITDVDAKSNRSKDSDKVLSAHKREKKKKCLGACLEQRRHFSHFVVSADGLLGKEAKILLRKLSSMLAEKWEKPHSEVCGYVNARMSIAIVRATHLCIRGSRIATGKMCNRLPQWEDKAGLGLFRH